MAESLYNCCGGADRFVVVDTETTGVYPSDRIVEIALVTISLTGEILDVYETMVQPERDVSASHIHGITTSMVVAAPTFEEIAGDVAVRLHGACLVAHNLPFDYRMLRNEFERLNAELVVPSGVDTLVATGARLGVACEEFNIDLLDAHSALADATATAKSVYALPAAADRVPQQSHCTNWVAADELAAGATYGTYSCLIHRSLSTWRHGSPTQEPTWAYWSIWRSLGAQSLTCISISRSDASLRGTR